MKLAISREHRDFFQKHHSIEFEGLLDPTKLHDLVTNVKSTLTNRLGPLDKRDSDALFSEGRDLWRISNPIKKIVTNPHFAEIASELTNQRVLRLGYTQYFPAPSSTSLNIEKGPYATLLSKKSTLEEISSLQGVQCGLMICLKDESNAEIATLPESTEIFPLKAGNGVFFSPKAFINFPELYKRMGNQFLMIVYTQATAVYVHCENDPLAYSLRNVGYAFGDKLLDKRNPILYR